MVLQRVAVEGVMQSFDVLVNRFSSAVMNRSVQIVSVLLQAFKQYTQDEDNDTAMFTAMSTLDCVSSVVMNACQEPMMYDSVVQIVMPVIMVFVDKNSDFMDACLLILRTVVHFYDNANTTRELIWQCFPHLLLIIQKEAIDFISGLFPVLDCYLNIDSSDMLNRSFNGVNYLQLLLNFVNDVAFDPELTESEQSYALGVLMNVVHYLYRK
ncbi:hypothetical protein JH06_4497 [Blastocystis sp. subtype 4]|uniref:hypothetical protein n=1 Tax=Blastocystis sp. subtype 4 TaxID=944170 RepID=UPI0007118550|nr:hypothetical protein JH06_4497 [Blastocystis sp. subtype 4]KNB42202.1 hypothetical protein JH06_4497 [Blastocystis sp. subtype 4]|eukprot:XP_014525645.1 hypothetical protein JH06_4497 [Blastocystis sp. subtype 4]